MSPRRKDEEVVRVTAYVPTTTYAAMMNDIQIHNSGSSTYGTISEYVSNSIANYSLTMNSVNIMTEEDEKENG